MVGEGLSSNSLPIKSLFRFKCISTKWSYLICNLPDGPKFRIQIFSSENNGWRDPAGPFYGILPKMQFQDRVHWKNSIHYLDEWGGNSIYFEIETEGMKSLLMPPMQSKNHTMNRSWYLGESGGHLHLVDVHTIITSDSTIDIYELRSDYSGWFIRCRVDISAIEAAFPEMVQYNTIFNVY
ncbi:hypothetical protein ACS0TY_020020 [Phlomoides rotata]